VIRSDLVGNLFTYDGVDCWAAFGAFSLGYTIPPFPNTRENDLDLVGHTGSYDAGTEVSRLDTSMQVGLWTNQGRAAIRQQIREFMALMDPRKGYRQLAFDEDPDYYLWAKLTSSSGSGGATISAGDREVAATLDLTFKSKDPHWYSVSSPTVTMPAFTSAASQTIDNVGRADTPAIITVTATSSVVGGFTVTLDGVPIGYSGDMTTGNVVVFDTDRWVVTRNGLNAIDKWTGKMPLVPPDASTISIDKAGLSAVLTYTPRWVA
jgi:phage-related protein